MIIFNKFVWSKKEPENKRDIWFDGSNLRIYTKGSWEILTNFEKVNHRTEDTTFTLTPNKFHVWDEVTELNLTLGEEVEGVMNEFLFEFTSGAEPTMVSLPDNIKWSETLNVEPYATYQISVLNGIAKVVGWEDRIIFTVNDVDKFKALPNMYWYDFVISSLNPYNEYGYPKFQCIDGVGDVEYLAYMDGDTPYYMVLFDDNYSSVAYDSPIKAINYYVM